jgi:hypothetical protein
LKHGGQLPGTRAEAKLADDAWQCPHVSRMRYGYRGGVPVDRNPAVLVVLEPDVFDGTLLGLFSDGAVKPVADDAAITKFAMDAQPW